MSPADGCAWHRSRRLMPALVVPLLTLATVALAQTPNGSPVVRAAALAESAAVPAIDGVVREDVWAKSDAFTSFVQQEPDEGRPATERTEVRFLIDGRHLYIGVICFDANPSSIIVNQGRRDADLDDTDSVRILLDTFHDRQNAFVFGTNPFGIESDGQVRAEGQTGGLGTSWDGDWTVRASITERGWEAEFAIPLKTLRYLPGDSQTWGVNVLRNIRHKNEQVYLAPIPRGYGPTSAWTSNGASSPTSRWT